MTIASVVLYNANGDICRIVHPDQDAPFDPSHPAWNVAGGVQCRIPRAQYDAITDSSDNHYALMQILQSQLTQASLVVGAKAQAKIDAVTASRAAIAARQANANAFIASLTAAQLIAWGNIATPLDLTIFLATISPAQLTSYNAMIGVVANASVGA